MQRNICPACLQYGYASIQVASLGDLYGGIICAALCGHNRPPHELLNPNRQPYSQTYKNEFLGMSESQFSESECNTIFDSLVENIHKKLSLVQKEFVFNFFSLKESLPPIDIPNSDRLPALQWKRMNLNKLQKTNPTKFTQQLKDLEHSLQ